MRVEYRIVVEHDARLLEGKVEALLNDGWELGPFAVEDRLVYQVVTRNYAQSVAVTSGPDVQVDVKKVNEAIAACVAETAKALQAKVDRALGMTRDYASSPTAPVKHKAGPRTSAGKE